MTILLTFALNAGLNFVLGLLVAKFLGPEEYGRYAVAVAVATVINTVLLDWLRLSATRFYSASAREQAPAVRATLDATFATMSLALVAAVAAVLVLRIDTGLPAGLVAALAPLSIAIGLFDYHAALARARFLERGYAQFVIVKNLAGFALMVGGAALFHDAAVVAAGFALSVVLSVAVARRVLDDPGSPLRKARRALAADFARYGLPLVAANAIFQLMTFANRTAAASLYGFAEAGHFSLAADLGIRIFAVAGSALDILLFQIAVRVDETHGREAAAQQVARNLSLVLAILLPAAVGYWLVLPSFEALFVPAAYRGAFSAYSAILIPALLSFALIQFALNPVFQIHKRTAPVIGAAAAGLAINLALMPLLPRTLGPTGFAAAQLFGMVAALAATVALAARLMPLVPRAKDILAPLAATAVLGLALAPFRDVEPRAATLAGLVVAGGLLYAALALVFDIGGFRRILKRGINSRGS